MADRYWVGGTGNWSDDDNHWATESNGTPGDGNIPTSSDDVYFDENSFSGADQVVTINVVASCADMDWTGVTNTPTFLVSNEHYIYGSLIFVSGMTVDVNSYYIYFYGVGTHTVTLAGHEIDGDLYFIGAGTYTLQDDVTTPSDHYLNISDGILNTNGQTLTTGYFSIGGGSLNLGASVVNVEGTDGGFDIRDLISFDAGTSTINLNGAGAYIVGSGTYYKVVANPSSGVAILYSGGTYNTIQINEGKSIQLEDGRTFTVTNFIAQGSVGNVITIASPYAGYQFTLSKPSGTVEVDYCDIKDSNATGGASWYAGSNSINSGNNTGWKFIVSGAWSEVRQLTVSNVSTNAGATELEKESVSTIAGAVLLEEEIFNTTAGQAVLEKPVFSTSAGLSVFEKEGRDTSAGQVVFEKEGQNASAGFILLEREIPPEPWTVQYEANELPTAATPVWTFQEWGIEHTTIEINPAGKLHIVAPLEDNHWWFRDVTLDDSVGATMEIRVKIVDAGTLVLQDYTAAFDVQTPLSYGSIEFYEDGIWLWDSVAQAYITSYSLDTTDDYHTYRLTIKDNHANAYVDGVLVISEDLESRVSPVSSYFAFTGNWGGAHDSEIYFDYVYYRIDGAFAPTVTTSGLTSLEKESSDASAGLVGLEKESKDSSAGLTVFEKETQDTSGGLADLNLIRIAYPWQRKQWYDGTYHWRASFDPTIPAIICEYSVDCSSWTENTSARITDASVSTDFAIRGNDPDYSALFIVYSNGEDIIGRRAKSYPAINFYWGNPITTYDGSADGGKYTFSNISYDGNQNKLNVVATLQKDVDDSYSLHNKIADKPNEIPKTTGVDKILVADQAILVYGSIRRVSDAVSGSLIAVWKKGTALEANYRSGTDNANDWGSDESIATVKDELEYSFCLEHDRDIGDSCVVYIKSDGKPYHRDRNAGTGIWADEDILQNDVNCRYVCLGEHSVGHSHIVWLDNDSNIRSRIRDHEASTYTPTLENPPTDWGGQVGAQWLNISDETPINFLIWQNPDSTLGCLVISDNAIPTKPTDLETEGQTNPIGVIDLTPELTGIFHDTDVGDKGLFYQIEVRKVDDSFASVLQFTDLEDMASSGVSFGASGKITVYGLGDANPEGGYLESGGFTDGNVWSTDRSLEIFLEDISCSAGATLTLTYDSGQTITIYLPEIIDGNGVNLFPTDDGSSWYNSYFSSLAQANLNTQWLMSKAEFIVRPDDGERCEDISYAGNALSLDGSKYYWRIRIWDLRYAVSPWSDEANFTMAIEGKKTSAGLASLEKEVRDSSAGLVLLEREGVDTSAGTVLFEREGLNTTAGQALLEKEVINTSAGFIELEKPALNTSAGLIELERVSISSTAGLTILEVLERVTGAGLAQLEKESRVTSAGLVVLEYTTKQTSAGFILLERGVPPIFEPWTVRYEADELPQDATPVWDRDAYNDGGIFTEEIVDSQLHIHLDQWSIIDYSQVPGFSWAIGGTVEARLKVLQAAGDEDIFFAVGVENYRFGVTISPTNVKIAAGRYEDNFALDGTVYHTYRLIFKNYGGKIGFVAYLYVDGILRCTLSTFALSISGNYVAFGHYSDTEDENESYWDYVYYRNDGAFVPPSRIFPAGLAPLEKVSLDTSAGFISLDRAGISSSAGLVVLESVAFNTTAGAIYLEVVGQVNTTAGFVELEKEIVQVIAAGFIRLEILRRTTSAGFTLLELWRALEGQIDGGPSAPQAQAGVVAPQAIVGVQSDIIEGEAARQDITVTVTPANLTVVATSVRVGE